jgi:hypothetical protein
MHPAQHFMRREYMNNGQSIRGLWISPALFTRDRARGWLKRCVTVCRGGRALSESVCYLYEQAERAGFLPPPYPSRAFISYANGRDGGE